MAARGSPPTNHAGVAVTAGSVERREVERRALEHDFEGAQSAVMDLYAKAFQTPIAAEATAIRPLD
jgi:hypothetical protein